jgi:hypothetical protein
MSLRDSLQQLTAAATALQQELGDLLQLHRQPRVYPAETIQGAKRNNIAAVYVCWGTIMRQQDSAGGLLLLVIAPSRVGYPHHCSSGSGLQNKRFCGY